MKGDGIVSLLCLFAIFMIGMTFGFIIFIPTTNTKYNVEAKVLEVGKSGIVTVEIAGGTKYKYIGSANVGEWLNITMDTADTKGDKTDDIVIKIN